MPATCARLSRSSPVTNRSTPAAPAQPLDRVPPPDRGSRRISANRAAARRSKGSTVAAREIACSRRPAPARPARRGLRRGESGGAERIPRPDLHARSARPGRGPAALRPRQMKERWCPRRSGYGAPRLSERAQASASPPAARPGPRPRAQRWIDGAPAPPSAIVPPVPSDQPAIGRRHVARLGHGLAEARKGWHGSPGRNSRLRPFDVSTSMR